MPRRTRSIRKSKDRRGCCFSSMNINRRGKMTFLAVEEGGHKKRYWLTARLESRRSQGSREANGLHTVSHGGIIVKASGYDSHVFQELARSKKKHHLRFDLEPNRGTVCVIACTNRKNHYASFKPLN